MESMNDISYGNNAELRIRVFDAHVITLDGFIIKNANGPVDHEFIAFKSDSVYKWEYEEQSHTLKVETVFSKILSDLNSDPSLGQGSRPGQLNSAVDVLISITILLLVGVFFWLLNRYSIINIF